MNIHNVMAQMFTNYIGPGSSEENIANFKSEFPEIVEKYNIESVADAGCGLGWIRKECDKLGVEYSGYDILERENATLLDITSEVIDKVDLIICRDVLLHVTTELAHSAIDNFKKSGSKYLLTTSWYNANNESRPKDFGSGINSFIDIVHILGLPLEKIEEPESGRFMGLWKL
jgi:hypothetical protein